MSTRTIRTCDLCDTVIEPDETYVNASTYGREAHTSCFAILTPMEVLGFLGLSDVKLMRGEGWAGAMKATSERESQSWKEHGEKRRADLNESITLR